jgi:hypothetical protein
MSHARRIHVLLGLLAAATGCTRTPVDRLGFNQDIQPILSEYCYQCHGPDSSSRKAGLRLDRAEFAYAPHGESGPAIVPGKPDQSPLVLRVEAEDADERMPPPEAHKTLQPAQIALLRRWVEEGAQYEEHWAFIAPTRPTSPVPPPDDLSAGWARNEIDRFVLARLRQEHLAPSPEADRHALIRRVTFDLTGLPPTPAEIDAFVADTSPEAYERLVDRLLANPRYGEHRAHYWLDVARYGDTHGLHLDNARSIWPYRAYVVRAYNANKPYDEFVREQLAGDLLPASTLDQLIATGYVRAGISSGEAGTLPEELRVNNQRERVEAFGAAFMGMTTGCAACHDHKFDPLTQEDFYRLTAFFNNLTEHPSNGDRIDWPPFVVIPRSPEARAAYENVLAERATVRRHADERRSQARDLIAAWLAQPQRRPLPVSTEGLQVRLRFDEQKGAEFRNVAPQASPARVTATGDAPQWGEDVWYWPSLRMETTTRIELPKAGRFDRDDAFSVGTWLMPRLGSASDTPVSTIISRIDANGRARGWELAYQEEGATGEKADATLDRVGRLQFNLFHDGPAHALRVRSRTPVMARGRWNHVLAVYDGSGRAAGVRLYVDGRPIEVEVLRDALRGSIDVDVPLNLARRHPDAQPLRQSRYQDFRLYARALSPDEAVRVARQDYVAEIVERPPARWSEQELETVADFYFAEHDEPMRALEAKLSALDAELGRLADGGDVSLVSEERPGLAYAHVLDRGAYSQRNQLVRPATPHFLPPMPRDAPLDRRGLAAWVVSPENPLTARVAVNRMWQELFGTGLVETTEDFGTVGARPSHPELLDWLAVDFRDSGWDVKRFYRQVVLSATYRQSARVTPALLEADPRNRLLARGPRFRLDAEMLRDAALSGSGLLVEQVGGPGVRPYQPKGVWEANSFPTSDTARYTQDHGEALYRRSLYTFWKRMATAPNMDTFDMPVRDRSCTRRQRTNTPMQALVVMNDPQWLEAARTLAEHLVRDAHDADARLAMLARRLVSRDWEPAEVAVLKRALEAFRTTYERDPSAATRLVDVGETPRVAGIEPRELAPWMLVASVAMNLDDALNK